MKELKKLDDNLLIKLYAAGTNEAFDVLIDRYKDKVYTSIFCTVKDEELANDIFQDTFVKVIVTIKQGRYTENGKFFAWIMRIAHNLIIDNFRQDKAEKVQSADDENFNLLNNRNLSEGNIEDDLITSQIHTDVRALVESLPDLQREVLVMRYYKDMSFKEIAEATNVSINTALGRMRYAILNMRRIAEEKNIILSF